MKIAHWAAAAAVAFVLLLSAASGGEEPAETAAEKAGIKSKAQRLSYAVGLEVGASLKQIGTELDTAALARAIEDALTGKEPLLEPAELGAIKEQFIKDMQAKEAERRAEAERKGAEIKTRHAEEAKTNLIEGPKFLAENKKNKGVVETATGLQYQVIKAGEGKSPAAADTVKVHYRGTLTNGTEFDSSYKGGQPAVFQVGRVISGWTEALQLMKPGAKYKLVIPSDLAYGAQSKGEHISPNSVLVFEVELLEVMAAPKLRAPIRQ